MKMISLFLATYPDKASELDLAYGMQGLHTCARAAVLEVQLLHTSGAESTALAPIFLNASSVGFAMSVAQMSFASTFLALVNPPASACAMLPAPIKPIFLPMFSEAGMLAELSDTILLLLFDDAWAQCREGRDVTKKSLSENLLQSRLLPL